MNVQRLTFLTIGSNTWAQSAQEKRTLVYLDENMTYLIEIGVDVRDIYRSVCFAHVLLF